MAEDVWESLSLSLSLFLTLSENHTFTLHYRQDGQMHTDAFFYT